MPVYDYTVRCNNIDDVDDIKGVYNACDIVFVI